VIEPERIEQIVAVVTRAGLTPGTVSALREVFPEMHFTHCLDDDIGGPQPVREAAGFNLYLVDGHDHCMRFTDAPERATGVVLAELTEED